MYEQCLDFQDPRFLPSKSRFLLDPDVLNDARTLPEVKAFREKYPTTIEVVWNEDESDYVEYVVERLGSADPDSPIKNSEALHLLIKYGSDGRTDSIEYQCGAVVTKDKVLDTVKTTQCAQKP